MSEFRLPRLLRGAQLTTPDGQPTQAFQQWWQSFAKTIEDQEAAQNTLLAAIQAVQDDLAAQLALITAAQSTADAVTLANAISASWIVPGSVSSAADTGGGTASITIANFTRFYDDQTSVAVTGAVLTGLANATQYAVYYDDATRANTAPTFHATTLLAEARHNYVSGRHYLDTITTPAGGGGGTSGGGYTPPGGGSGGTVLP